MVSIRKQLLFLLLLSACTGRNKDKSERELSDNLFETLGLVDLQHRRIAPEKYRGKTVFLNVWATWCKPCVQEIPSIEKARNIIQDETLVFILASGDNAEEIQAFRNANNYDFDFVRIENTAESRIQALPTTFILDPAGKIIFSESGARKWDEKENIDMLIKYANQND